MPSFEDFQSPHIARLQEDFSRGAFVHAYLFTGPHGTGKKSVARLCAMTALCKGAHKPCGVCGPCRRVQAGTHPDVHVLEPEKGKKFIRVDAVRELIAALSMSSFEEKSVRVVLVDHAELLNANAQNALLKTLEEPPENTVFFLTTAQPTALLDTIVSRCRTVRFSPLPIKDAAARLVALGETPERAAQKARMAEGCVGRALEIDDAALALREQVTRDIFSIRGLSDVYPLTALYAPKASKTKTADDESKKAKAANKENKAAALDILENALRDVLLHKTRTHPLSDAGYAPQTERYAEAVPIAGVLDLMEAITRARRMLDANVPFSSALESVLIKTAEEYQQWPW